MGLRDSRQSKQDRGGLWRGEEGKGEEGEGREKGKKEAKKQEAKSDRNGLYTQTRLSRRAGRTKKKEGGKWASVVSERRRCMQERQEVEGKKNISTSTFLNNLLGWWERGRSGKARPAILAARARPKRGAATNAEGAREPDRAPEREGARKITERWCAVRAPCYASEGKLRRPGRAMGKCCDSNETPLRSGRAGIMGRPVRGKKKQQNQRKLLEHRKKPKKMHIQKEWETCRIELLPTHQ